MSTQQKPTEQEVADLKSRQTTLEIANAKLKAQVDELEARQAEVIRNLESGEYSRNQ